MRIHIYGSRVLRLASTFGIRTAGSHKARVTARADRADVMIICSDATPSEVVTKRRPPYWVRQRPHPLPVPAPALFALLHAHRVGLGGWSSSRCHRLSQSDDL